MEMSDMARPGSCIVVAMLMALVLAPVPGAAQGRALVSIFFGGGTPSLFAPDEVGRFLEAARSLVRFAPDVEVTLEANPGTVEHGRFSGVHAGQWAHRP